MFISLTRTTKRTSSFQTDSVCIKIVTVCLWIWKRLHTTVETYTHRWSVAASHARGAQLQMPLQRKRIFTLRNVRSCSFAQPARLLPHSLRHSVTHLFIHSLSLSLSISVLCMPLLDKCAYVYSRVVWEMRATHVWHGVWVSQCRKHGNLFFTKFLSLSAKWFCSQFFKFFCEVFQIWPNIFLSCRIRKCFENEN